MRQKEGQQNVRHREQEEALGGWGQWSGKVAEFLFPRALMNAMLRSFGKNTTKGKGVRIKALKVRIQTNSENGYLYKTQKHLGHKPGGEFHISLSGRMLRKRRASLEAADAYSKKRFCCLHLVTPWEQKPEPRKEWPCARYFENE